jgi:hypothetical protein
MTDGKNILDIAFEAISDLIGQQRNDKILDVDCDIAGVLVFTPAGTPGVMFSAVQSAVRNARMVDLVDPFVRVMTLRGEWEFCQLSTLRMHKTTDDIVRFCVAKAGGLVDKTKVPIFKNDLKRIV